MSLEEETETDFLNLSDEEFDKFGGNPPTQESEEDKTDDSEDVADIEKDLETSDSDESEDDDSEEEEETEQPEGTAEDSSEDEEEESNDEETGEEEESTTPTESERHKAFYDAITAPIKANGREIKLDDPEEVKKLIQMGVGYNAKMLALKPSRQFIKTLEKHNMLDESSINYAIDLVSGNKDAILKLLKEKNIDPQDLDIESASGYKPSTVIASGQSVEFDDVLDSIKHSEHYNATINTVREWDKNSQDLVAKTPSIISDLNAQMTNGIYSTVMNELDKRRSLGDVSITGLSDLEAYVTVGRLLASNGTLPNPNAQGSESTSNVGRKVLPKEKSGQNPETRIKKKAAGLPKNKPPVDKTSDESNPLAMSDKDFDKLMAKFN